MACQITNNSNLDIADFEDTMQQLVSFSQDRFGFEKPPALFLNSDTSNASDPLGKTAYYDPENKEIHIYVDERHPKDIMRSISHELIHHVQNLRGDLSGNHYHGEGYAQKDEHMREMEREAYEQGNLCFRDFEDKLKLDKTTYNEWRTNKMSLKEWKNNELFTLLSNKWGFGKNTITEAKGDVDPNMPIDALKKQLEDAGIDTTGMSAKDMDEKAAMLRLGNPKKYTALGDELEEAEKPFDDGDNKDEKCDYVDCDNKKELGESTCGNHNEKLKEFVVDSQESNDSGPITMADISEEQLDEDEVEESVGAFRDENRTRNAGRKRMSDDRVHEEAISEGGMKDLHTDIENMLDNGASTEEIVAELGCSKDDVEGVRQDMTTAKTELKEAIRKTFTRLLK